MVTKDLKYLAAYIIPLTAILAFYLKGGWSYSTVIFAFGIIPLLDPFMPNSKVNLNEDQRKEKLKAGIFDWLLYLNIPILYGVIVFFLYTISSITLTTNELTGMTLSCGIVIGTCGINVGHELGHRNSLLEQTLAKTLLLPALYMHFFIEHNLGHHRHVATPNDPASAKKGEILYFFWLKSIIGSYRNAWRLEAKRLQKSESSLLEFA